MEQSVLDFVASMEERFNQCYAAAFLVCDAATFDDYLTFLIEQVIIVTVNTLLKNRHFSAQSEKVLAYMCTAEGVLDVQKQGLRTYLMDHVSELYQELK